MTSTTGICYDRHSHKYVWYWNIRQAPTKDNVHERGLNLTVQIRLYMPSVENGDTMWNWSKTMKYSEILQLSQLTTVATCNLQCTLFHLWCVQLLTSDQQEQFIMYHRKTLWFGRKNECYPTMYDSQGISQSEVKFQSQPYHVISFVLLNHQMSLRSDCFTATEPSPWRWYYVSIRYSWICEIFKYPMSLYLSWMWHYPSNNTSRTVGVHMVIHQFPSQQINVQKTLMICGILCSP